MWLLTDFRSKVAVMFSDHSLLWQLPPDPIFPKTEISVARKDVIAERFNVTGRKNLENWARDNGPTPLFERFIASLNANSPLDISMNDFEPTTSIEEFGLKFGISERLSQKIRDTASSALVNASPLFYHSPDQSAEADERTTGLYSVYRYDRNDNFEGLTIMALHVRHRVEFDVEKSKRMVLKAKLNVPNYFRPHESTFVYDGFVGPTDRYQTNHWHFEQRRAFQKDAIFLITEGGEPVQTPSGRVTEIRGHALTRDQSVKPKPAAMPILLRESPIDLRPAPTLPDMRLLNLDPPLHNAAQEQVWDRGYADDAAARTFMQNTPANIPVDELTEEQMDILKALKSA